MGINYGLNYAIDSDFIRIEDKKIDGFYFKKMKIGSLLNFSLESKVF